MARNSLLERYEPFVAAAVIGAHANGASAGFRQHDVRFMVEIFTNWASSGEQGTTLIVQNTQVARYIEALVEEGFARKLTKEKHPRYRLTRTGLIECASRVISKEYYPTREHFFFVYLIVEAYRKRILKMIQSEGKRFPYSLQLELESLIDPVEILNRQLQFAERELTVLERRIADSKKIAAFVQEQSRQGMTYRDIIKRIDRAIPFAINSQSRMTEVFSMGTDRQGLWELQVGNRKRVECLWEPSRNMLAAHIEELRRLKKAAEKEQAAERQARAG